MNGHPDFEKYACNEVTEDLVLDNLAAGVPVYRYNGTGLDPVTGVDPNNVCGATGTPAISDRSQQLTSAADFAQWYTDTAKSSRVDGTQLRLTRTGAVGNYSYVFDSATDAPYSSLGGFFPIDGKGFGNEGKDSKRQGPQLRLHHRAPLLVHLRRRELAAARPSAATTTSGSS